MIVTSKFSSTQNLLTQNTLASAMPKKRKLNEKRGADATANQHKTSFTKFYKAWRKHKNMKHVLTVVVDEKETSQTRKIQTQWRFLIG